MDTIIFPMLPQQPAMKHNFEPEQATRNLGRAMPITILQKQIEGHYILHHTAELSK